MQFPRPRRAELTNLGRRLANCNAHSGAHCRLHVKQHLSSHLEIASKAQIPIAELHIWFWSDVAATGGALILMLTLATLSFVRVRARTPWLSANVDGEPVQSSPRWQKIAASIFLVFGWSGGLFSAAQSRLLSNGEIDWSYLDTGFHPMLLVLQPMALTIFWLALVSPQDRVETAGIERNTQYCLLFDLFCPHMVARAHALTVIVPVDRYPFLRHHRYRQPGTHQNGVFVGLEISSELCLATAAAEDDFGRQGSLSGRDPHPTKQQRASLQQYLASRTASYVTEMP